jgi:ABC-type sulfate transport system permease subunit
MSKSSTTSTISRAAFAVASLLAGLALVTLVVKTILESATARNRRRHARH